MLSHERRPRDTTVNFDTYRILQLHRTVYLLQHGFLSRRTLLRERLKIINALFNALYFLRTGRALTHFIFAINVRNNYGHEYNNTYLNDAKVEHFVLATWGQCSPNILLRIERC